MILTVARADRGGDGCYVDCGGPTRSAEDGEDDDKVVEGERWCRQRERRSDEGSRRR